MQVNKTELRFGFGGAFTSREAMRIRWENVSWQAPPFQGRRPPPPGGGGEGGGPTRIILLSDCRLGSASVVAEFDPLDLWLVK